MQIEYDAEADALYIRLRDAVPTDSIDVDDGITIDLDAARQLVGIEILDVGQRLPPDALASVTLKNLMFSQTPS